MTKKVMGAAIAALLCLGFLLPINADRDTLLNENFDGDWDYDNPPGDWQIWENGDDPNGDRGDWSPDINDNGRAQIYWVYDYNGPFNTDELISPVLDCSDPQYESVWLYLFHNYDWYGWPYNYDAYILGSTNGGSSWPETIFDYDDETHGPMYEYFDITEWAMGETEVMIEFYGEGATYSINWWDVDNVIVYGEWTGGGGGELDLEMSAINRPFDEEEGGVPFTPSCKIWNNTDADVEALVTCKIRDIEDWEYVYEEGLSNFVCNPGYTDCDAFDDFTPERGKKYRIEFVVDHPDDINHDNDNLDKRFTTILGTQVDATEILAPVGEQHLQFDPSCKFMEMLDKETPDIWLHCMIEGGSFHQVYHDSTQYTFAASEEYPGTFGTTDLADGDYTIVFWAVGPRGGDVADAIGEIQTDTFTYLGIAEEPTLDRYSLDVVGSTISYTLGSATDVDLKVYDVAGNVVQTLVSGTRAAGSYNVTWDGDVSGVYFVKLLTREFNAVRKLTVLH